MLQARGHRVTHVVCDQALPACETKKSKTTDDWDRLCGRCWSLGRHLSTSYGLDVLPVSQLVSDQQPSDSEEGTLGPIIEASLLKHFMVGSLEYQPDIGERKNAYRESAQKSVDVGRSIQALEPDRVVMSHGIYSTWGPAREFLLENDIPVITYGKGKKRQTIKFNWTTSADWWDVSDEWEKVNDTPLTADQTTAIDTYLDSRRNHTNDTLVYNFAEEEAVEKTKSRLGLSSDKPTFTAFTNVLWDAASAQREIAFENPIKWILETIAWFGQHPNKQLIVKIHPAEVVIGTNQPFDRIISEKIGKLPDNVRLIKPDEKVNSWSIIKVTDLGLVHTSTVGMELPLEGVPCAVVSKTHFRDRGFTIDVESKDEYFELLENFDSSSAAQTDMVDFAKRYAYLLFERYQLPFKFFDEPSHADVRSFDIEALKGISDSAVAKSFISTLERGSGSFLRNS